MRIKIIIFMLLCSASLYASDEARILMLEDQRSLGDSVLVNFLTSSADPQIRARAALALGRIGDKSVVPALTSGLQDSSEDVRRLAAFALGEIADTTAVPALLAQLEQSPNPETIDALGKMPTAAGFRTLVMTLDRNPVADDTVYEILRVLWRFDKPGIAAVVSPFTKSKNRKLKQMAVYCLMRLRDESATPLLMPLLDDDDSYVRALAIGGLQKLTRLEDLKKIMELLDDKDIQVQINTLRALGRLGFERILDSEPILKKAAKGPINVRLTAIELLGTLGDPAAIPLLRQMLSDPSLRVRQVSLVALAKVEKNNALATIERLQYAYEWRIRDAVVEAYQLINEPKTLEAIKMMTDDADPTVRATAMSAYMEKMMIAQPDSVHLIKKLLHEKIFDPNPVVSTIALGLLAALPDSTELIPFLMENEYKFHDVSVDFRREVVDVFAKIRTDQALDLLDRMRDDPAYVVRKAAADKLSELTDSTYVCDPVDTDKTSRDYDELLGQYPSDIRAKIKTNKGDIEVELYPRDALLTVHNFVTLTEKGYFNGLTFHRVVPNFVIQAGCPNGNGWGGPGYEIRCEINRRRFDRGTMGMALSGKDTGGSQFFITHSPQPHLDGGYTIFGHVRKGMDVVDKIEQYDRIESVEIIR